MYKRLTALILCLCLLLCTGCGSKQENSLAEALSTLPPPSLPAPTQQTIPAEIRLPDMTAPTQPGLPEPAAQLEIIDRNRELWFVSDPSALGDVWYAVTDLDWNGRLELLRGHMFGQSSSLGLEPVSAFQVSADGTTLEALTWQVDGSMMSFPNAVEQWLSGFRDGDNFYYMLDAVSSGPMGSANLRTLLSIQGDRLCTEVYAIAETARNAYGDLDYRFYTPPYTKITQDEFVNIIPDRMDSEGYIEVTPGWYNVSSPADISDFLRWSLEYYQRGYGTPFSRRLGEGCDLLVEIDEPGNRFPGAVDGVRVLRTGYEYEHEDSIRVTAGREGLTVVLEAVASAQIGGVTAGIVPAYPMLTFRPAMGVTYEIPVFLPEGAPELRVYVFDEQNSDWLDLFVDQEDGMPMRYSEVGLVCAEHTMLYPRDYDPIVGAACAFAAWTVQAGAPENIGAYYWDALADALWYNLLVGLNPDSQGNPHVPAWLAEQYAAAMYAGFAPALIDPPEMTAATAIRPCANPEEGRIVDARGLANLQSTRVNRICPPEELGYDGWMSDLVIELIVAGDYETSVLVFINRTDSNCLGWYISNAYLAMG